MELLTWEAPDVVQSSIRASLARINWNELCLRASRLNNGLLCTPLDLENAGLNNVVRLLQFPDSSTVWVVRIPLNDSDTTCHRLQAEIDAMHLIAEKTDVRLPRIFDYELTANNPVGVPFILMEFLPGNVAMDMFGGWEVHHGVIPSRYRDQFFLSVAETQVKLAKLTFPKIGIVTKDAHGRYDIGPFPNLGGPFDTATEFFIAWARCANFPTASLDLLAQGASQQEDLIYEIKASIYDFPGRLSGMVKSREIILKGGQFPICHADLMHSNIVVDNDYNVLGFIDWEGACTLPWELVEFPLFLDTIPQAFNTPDKYDKQGTPLDPDTRQCWHDRMLYLNCVKSCESADNHRLSEALEDPRSQSLAYAMRHFNQGKLGLYNRILDQYVE